MNTSKALIILSITLFSTAWSHRSGEGIPCKHDTLEFNPEIGHFDEEYLVSNSRVLQDATSYPNIRIYPYYDSLTFGTDDFKSYIKNELIPPIISLLQAALRLKYPLKSPMLLTQSKICGLDTPPILNVTGVDTDFFIFLAATEDNSSSWVASASNCMVSSGIKRPTIAYLALNTYAIRPVIPDSNPLGHEYNMYVLMHEIFHSLGFSQNFFNNYVDSQGNLLTGHVKKVLLAGTNRTVIDVAPLTQRLRNFYGCPTLEGAFMEDDGGSGTAGSHWERRFFPFDLLSSGAIHGRRITEFTLAFLEGTGWYAPDYSYAEPFFFGQGQGCSFIYTACDSAANSSQFDDYCVGNGRACTSIGRGGGFCKNDICSDSCRFVTPQLEYDCENPNGIYYTPFSSKQVYGRGLGSKCFSGNLSTSGAVSKTTYCLKFNCVGQGVNTTLELSFGPTKLTCAQKGQISVTGYSGFVDCPDPIQFCNTIAKPYCPRGCSARGACVNNQCVCNPGFKGVDCAYRDLTITTQTM